MKKEWLLTFLLLALKANALACTVCKSQQPKFTQGITHGTGPESNWDYLIIGTAIAVVVGTLIYSIRFLLKPERNRNHIKNSILTPPLYE